MSGAGSPATRTDMNDLEISDLVLWSDETLLVVNKPAGLPTLPDGYNPTAPYLGGILTPAFGRLWVVHRLDRYTSGVVAFARTSQAHRTLNTQFEGRQVSKVYHALVVGNPDWTEKTVRQPLLANGDRRHRTVVDAQKGKTAETSLRVLEQFGGFALVEAVPHTGRTHQIRAHLAFLGLPIVADELYGGGLEHPPLERTALHASRLTLNHPANGERIGFEAPYPEDFRAGLKHLRIHHGER